MGRPGTRQPAGTGREYWHGSAVGYNKMRCGCERCRAYIRGKRAESYARAIQRQRATTGGTQP